MKPFALYVISGAGSDFCSGADLAALQKIAEGSTRGKC